MTSDDVIDAEAVEVSETPSRDVQLLAPAGTDVQIIAAFERYQGLRERLIVTTGDNADVQGIQGKQFVKKSGWRKIATAFGISVEYVERNYTTDEHGAIVLAEVQARALAPNGRHFDALGLCDRYEKCCPQRVGSVCRNTSPYHTHCSADCDGWNHFSHAQHDIPATAATRAANRAIADLVGFGEVSAEEVTSRDEPASRADIDAIAAALNTISSERIVSNQEATYRSVAKWQFKKQFGMPEELQRGQIERARTWVESAGGTFAPTSEASSGEDAAPSVEPDPPADVSAGPPAGGSGDESAAVVPSTGTVEGQGAETPPPTDSSPEPAHQSPQGEGEPAPGPESAAISPSPPAPPAPSTAAQRQQIAMRCNDLGIEKPDVELIVAILTKGRATSRKDLTSDEAATMLALLRHMKAGRIVLADVELDGTMVRGLEPKDTTGVQFLDRFVSVEVP